MCDKGNATGIGLRFGYASAPTNAGASNLNPNLSPRTKHSDWARKGVPITVYRAASSTLEASPTLNDS